MKNCPKCGRANQPTRKYCIRCGGLLLTVEQKPKTISPPTEPEVKPEVRETQPPIAPTSEARVTTNDQWVKPSSVSRDRVRTTTGLTKPKSEMEKAKEAFARAEEVGIEETGEGIIETRMLRASEVQELMGDLEKQRQVTEPQPVTTPATQPPPMSTPPGTTGLPPGSVQPTQSPTPSGTPPGAPKPTPVQQPKPATVEKPVPQPGLAPKPAMSTPPSAPPIIPKRDISSTARIPQVDAIMSEITDSQFLKDAIIKDTFNDLTNQYTELVQFNSDLDSVRNRLQVEVRDCWNQAEVKRINFESLEEQTRLAKQEWTDATKVFQTADKRMKNELSTREKRIKDIEKRIEKTEDIIRKRVKELEKEKDKEAQS